MKKDKQIKFSKKELLNLDETLAKYIYNALYAFKHMRRGVPVRFDSEKEWEETLDKMLWAFKEINEGHFGNVYPSQEEIAKENKIREGLYLFADHFECLWD